MSDWFEFLLGSLATYRLALMFSKESGPGDIFRWIRAVPRAGSLWRKGLSCTLCESVWWSAVFTGYLYFAGEIGLWVTPIWWLGQSAAAVIANQLFTKGEL